MEKMSISGFHISADDHPPDRDLEFYFPSNYQFFRLLEVRYLPGRLLKGPLPLQENPTGCPACRLHNHSHSDANPSVLGFIWALQRDVDFTREKPKRISLETVPNMVEAAITRAVSEGNALALEMLLDMSFAINEGHYATRIESQYFITAAQRLDIRTILILPKRGQAVFPFSQSNIAMQDPVDLGHYDPPSLLVSYFDYLQEKQVRKEKVDEFWQWEAQKRYSREKRQVDAKV
jgi:hypothetical protein